MNSPIKRVKDQERAVRLIHEGLGDSASRVKVVNKLGERRNGRLRS